MADANTKRDYRIFEEFAYRVIAEARECRATDIFKLNGFDSTTIELCLNAFKWAIYRQLPNPSHGLDEGLDDALAGSHFDPKSVLIGDAIARGKRRRLPIGNRLLLFFE